MHPALRAESSTARHPTTRGWAGGDPATLRRLVRPPYRGSRSAKDQSNGSGTTPPKPSRDHPGTGRLNHGFRSEWKLGPQLTGETSQGRKNSPNVRPLRALRQPLAGRNRPRERISFVAPRLECGGSEGVTGYAELREDTRTMPATC